jgi:hypothetical protein
MRVKETMRNKTALVKLPVSLTDFAKYSAVALLLVTLQARAQEMPIRSANPKPIHSAISIYLTNKGEQSLSRNLTEILDNAGISVSSGYFPEEKFVTSKPIPLSQLAGDNPEIKKTIDLVRTLLQQWLEGFELKDPQPTVTLKSGGYRLSLADMSVSTDRAALKILGKPSGAVLVLQARINTLSMGSDSLTLSDKRNPYLGTIGILSPALTITPNSGRTLDLRVPVYIDVTSKGIQVQVLSADTNLDQTKLGFTYSGLILPDISVVINGHAFPANKKKMASEFEAMKPKLIEHLKAMVGGLVHSNLAKFANDGLAKVLKGKLEQVSPMAPPGRPVGSRDPDFRWGIGLEKISMGDQVTAIQLMSYVEDPKSPGVALDPEAQTRGPVSMAGAKPDQFDLGLAVGRGLINRILQLAFDRGYVKGIEVPPTKKGGLATKLRMLSPPQLDTYRPTAGQDSLQPKITLKVSLGSPIDDWVQRTMIDNEVRFTMSVVGRLVTLPGQKGLHIQIDTVDESTVDVHDDSLTPLGQLFKGVVTNGVLDKLRTVSAGWKTKPNIVDGELPLPPELFGQKLEMQNMRMDRSGYMILFLNFPSGMQAVGGSRVTQN